TAAPHDTLDVGDNPMNIVVRGRDLVWTDAAGAVWTTPSDGRAPRVRLHDPHDGHAMSLVTVNGVVYATMGHDLLRLSDNTRIKLDVKDDIVSPATDGTDLYAVLFRDPTILRISLDGTHVTPAFSLRNAVLASAGTMLYATSYATGELVSYDTRTHVTAK